MTITSSGTIAMSDIRSELGDSGSISLKEASDGTIATINTVNDRRFMLESIKYIDKVIMFDDTKGLEKEIEVILPDIMVIGSDWKDKTVIGKQYAGKLVFFNRIGDYSTTNILNGKTNNI